MDKFVLQTTVDISLFREPDMVVHHHKHELHHGSQHGSVCIWLNLVIKVVSSQMDP